MNRKSPSLIPPFILSYIGSLSLGFFLPWAHFMGFAGFLTLCLARLPLPTTLWIATLIGFYIDISSPSGSVGFFALNYCLTALITFRYRNYFNEEKMHIFALYTVLFSFVSTAIHCVLYALIDLHLAIRWMTLVTDLLLLPILDGVYAFLFVLAPLFVIKYVSDPKRQIRYRRAWRNFVFRTKKLGAHHWLKNLLLKSR